MLDAAARGFGHVGDKQCRVDVLHEHKRVADQQDGWRVQNHVVIACLELRNRLLHAVAQNEVRRVGWHRASGKHIHGRISPWLHDVLQRRLANHQARRPVFIGQAHVGVQARLVHVKIHQRDLFARLGEDAGEVGRHKALALLRMQRGHKDDAGAFFGKQILQVGAERTERFSHCTAVVGAARDGVVAHFLVEGNARNDRRLHRLAQFRGRLDALEEHHARHCKCKCNEESHSCVGQDGAALVRTNHTAVACALNELRFRRDAGSGDDGRRLALEQVHGELFIDAQLAFHGEDVALGLGKA